MSGPTHRELVPIDPRLRKGSHIRMSAKHSLGGANEMGIRLLSLPSIPPQSAQHGVDSGPMMTPLADTLTRSHRYWP